MASDPIQNSEWRELLDALPESEAEVLRRIDELVESGDHQTALDRLEAALSRASTARLRVAYGHVALDEQRFDDARRVLEPASRDDDAPMDAHLLLTEACLGGDAPEAAAQALKRAERHGASGGRYTILARRVSAALPDSDGLAATGDDTGADATEEPLTSTVDATLSDLIEASADGGAFDESEAALSPDTTDSDSSLHTEARAGEELDDADNPFADMEDTVYDDGVEPTTQEVHQRPDEIFSGESTTSPDSETHSVDESSDEETEDEKIGRAIENADENFYADIEDTTFDGALTSDEDLESMLDPESAPTTEQDAPPTGDEAPSAEQSGPATDERDAPVTEEQQAPPSDPPSLSDLHEEPDDAPTVETEPVEEDTDDEVFSITTSSDGTGVYLDEMLVEAPLETSEDMFDTDATDIDDGHAGPLVDEADDIEAVDTDTTHLFQLDDDPDDPTETADEHPSVDANADDDVDDSPTTPDLPRSNREPGSPQGSVQIPADEFATDPKGSEEPPTTPDVPSSNDRSAPQGRPASVRDEDEIPTDPEVPDANSRAPRSQEPSANVPASDRHSDNSAGREHPPGPRSSRQGGRSSGRSENKSPASRGRRGGNSENRGRPSEARRDRRSESKVEDKPTVGLEPQGMESGESKVTPPPRSETGIVDRFRHFADRWPLPEWLNSRSALLLSVVTVATLTAALLFIGAATTWVDNNRLMSALERVERERAPDTYQGWRAGFESADRTLGSNPGPVRGALHSLGSLLPLSSPDVLRRNLKQKRAFYAAMLEYRYEAYGERNAAELAEEAFAGESSLAATTDTYRLLAEGRHMEAVQRAKQAHHSQQDDRPLANAYLAALLETEQAGEVLRESSDLEARVSSPTVYERFLLARSARYKKDAVAHVLFEALVQQHSPGHLDAQIERVHALNDKESYQEAKTLARQLLDEAEGTASSYQTARLHIALGETYQKMGKHARAEEQFRSAIKAKPTRTSVYLPLTDLFIDDGRLGKARQEVEAAEAKAQPSPPLQKRKAHLLFLRGKFDEALSHVNSAEATSAYAPILEGRIRLEQGDYKRAREIFNGIDKSHPRYPAAKSLELFARTQMGIDDPKAVVEELASILDDDPSDPLVLRTAARIRLHYARRTIGADHHQHLSATFDRLREAIEAQPDRSLNQYLMCEAQLIANDGSEAAMACRKAKRKNPDFLPGMLTVTRLYLRRGDLTKAASVLDRLEKQFGDQWEIAKLRVRTMIHRHDIDEARALLDEWLQQSVAEEVEFHLFDGLIAFARADYPRALGHFEKAEEDHRYQDEAKLYRAHTLARLGELEKAESLIRDEMTVHPRWRAAAWLVFGEIRRRQGRHDDAMENLGLAEKHFDSGLTPPWRLSHLYKERAFTIRDREGWSDDRVAEYLDEGKRKGDTESPEIQLGLGLYYFDGPEVDLERAATHLKKVVDLQPHRCQAVQALAETYRELRNSTGEDEMKKLDRKHCDR